MSIFAVQGWTPLYFQIPESIFKTHLETYSETFQYLNLAPFQNKKNQQLTFAETESIQNLPGNSSPAWYDTF